jgi:fusaric acid resistance family protein
LGVNLDVTVVRKRISRALSRAMQRVVADAWPMLQGTIAATAAWVIAKYVFDHPEPFFAPVAAVVALNATVGERGINAVRLLQGVVVGIVVGELVLAALGSGYGSLGLAIFVAAAIARALGGARIVVAQAAVGAILTVAVADPEAGVERLLDALIGGSVALVFSQLLFSPEPVALLRRAETAALTDMADGLDLTARAVEVKDDELGEQALSRLRDVRDRLAELGRMRRASTRVARRSLVWRSRAGPVVRENENAGYLDLLGVSCLMLARTAITTSVPERSRLVPSVRELSRALSDLAKEPGNRATRQGAVDRALAVASTLAGDDAHTGSYFAAAVMAARMVSVDIMMFAGVEPDEAEHAVQEGTGQFEVPTPPPTPRTPFSR